MFNIFIDSQIWLSFYKLSNEDLEQLKQLNMLLEKEIKLFLTQQVVDEVRRNRENVIAETLKGFEKSPELAFPTFVKAYPEYTDLKIKLTDLQQAHKDWLAKIKDDIKNRELLADKIIDDIFNNEKNVLPVTNEIIEKSMIRYNRGNPPGKEKSYGDAINWEILLDKCKTYKSLYFLGNDKDYLSIDKNSFSPFLLNEWKRIKKSDIILCKTLSSFFNEYTNLLKLGNIEIEIDNIIKELENSGSFSTTHNKISKLIKFDLDVFNDDQIEWLCEIAVTNDQVLSIIEDSDIKEFYTNILIRYDEKNEIINPPDSVVKVNIKLDSPNINILPF